MYHFARELGRIAVSLEHRYIGESLPLGNTNISWAVLGLKYLTLDNIIADAVSFIEMVKARYPGAADSKAVVASGTPAPVPLCSRPG
jgi:hypothetical protein